MYKCERCNKTSKTGDKLNKIVVQTREKTYLNPDGFDKQGKLKYKISYGNEIVKELNVCNECI